MTRVGKAFVIVGAVLIAGLVAAFIMTAPILPTRPHIGDESGPVDCLRIINTAEITYAYTYPKIGFSPNLWSLGGETSADFQPDEENAGLVDPNLRAGRRAGYLFTYSVTRDEKSRLGVSYAAHADPDPEVPPGHRVPRNLLEQIFPKPAPRLYFYSDQTGVIRYEKDHEANASSLALQ